jgi:hypothetical protein
MNTSDNLFGTPREWAIDLATATVIGVFLGVIGPFGSFNGGHFELRVVFWVVTVWMGYIVLSSITRLSLWVATGFDIPVWFAMAVGVALGCIPLGLMIAFFSAWFWQGETGHLSPFIVWYGETVAIAEPFSFAYYFIGRRSIHTGQHPPPAADCALRIDEPVADQNGGATFLDRMPPRMGRVLLCLQMEDHYVRAHTQKGSDLILISLKDAIAELGDTPGMQVHRSWWVAKDAVSGPVANGRNLSLRLVNGVLVPVSRASVAKLKAAKWISPSGSH